MPDVYEPDHANVGAPLARRPPRAPRWVKVFAAVGFALLALLLVMLLVQRGGHGPGQHFSGQANGRFEVYVAPIGAAS